LFARVHTYDLHAFVGTAVWIQDRFETECLRFEQRFVGMLFECICGCGLGVCVDEHGLKQCL